MVEREMLRKAGVREVERDESESLRFEFLFLSFFVSGSIIGFLRVQMERMWSSGREWFQSALLNSTGYRPVPRFLPAVLEVGVCNIVGLRGSIFGLFFANRGMLLRRGLYFGPGCFSLPWWILRRECTEGCGFTASGMGGGGHH